MTQRLVEGVSDERYTPITEAKARMTKPGDFHRLIGDLLIALWPAAQALIILDLREKGKKEATRTAFWLCVAYWEVCQIVVQIRAHRWD